MSTPDLEAVKSRQRQVWATGDYASIASLIVPIAEDLADAADVQAGCRVLDVATGSGNAAIAAARRNCRVTGLDYVPALLDRARVRAAAEDLSIEWVEGDAENLPFPDGSFDAVFSVFGAMFAPNHVKTARELARVCRPGGRIALASWTPTGFIGEFFKVSAKYAPSPPGVEPPVLWGTPDHLARLFDKLAHPIADDVCTYTFRFESPHAYLKRFRTQFGPLIKAFEAAGDANSPALERDILDLLQRHNRNAGDPIAVPAEYRRTVLRKA